jgi:CRISPR/Cas system-associated protein Cas5 (RAMP superfamily)
MYYIEINSEDSNKLVYYCRKCGNKDSLLAVDNLCVSKVQIKKSEQSFNHIINKYTKLDPTLPRVSKILCPNPDCKTNHGSSAKENEEREIIYLRYDAVNIKYVYLCSTCDTVWNNNDNN